MHFAGMEREGCGLRIPQVHRRRVKRKTSSAECLYGVSETAAYF